MAPGRRYFRSTPFDRAAVRRVDARWIAEQLQSGRARVLPVHNGRVGLRRTDDGGGVELAWCTTIAEVHDPEYLVFLGTADGAPYFAFSPSAAQLERLSGAGVEFRGMRSLAAMVDGNSAGIGAYARAMDLWQRDHRYCGSCGTRTRVDQGGFRRYCDRCEREHFPRLDPAVIVAVTHQQRLLLGRQGSWPAGRYSVLAGFVEPGETLEAAVRREVAEEAGVAVGRVDYRGSQPWPFPSSLMIGFRAEAQTARIRLDDDELEDARWFDVDTLRADAAAGRVLLSPSLSISRFLIDEWIHEQCGEDSSGWCGEDSSRGRR